MYKVLVLEYPSEDDISEKTLWNIQNVSHKVDIYSEKCVSQRNLELVGGYKLTARGN